MFNGHENAFMTFDPLPPPDKYTVIYQSQAMTFPSTMQPFMKGYAIDVLTHVHPTFGLHSCGLWMANGTHTGTNVTVIFNKIRDLRMKQLHQTIPPEMNCTVTNSFPSSGAINVGTINLAKVPCLVLWASEASNY